MKWNQLEGSRQKLCPPLNKGGLQGGRAGLKKVFAAFLLDPPAQLCHFMKSRVIGATHNKLNTEGDQDDCPNLARTCPGE